MTSVPRRLLWLLAALAGAAAQAESLQDPTRPPAAFHGEAAGEVAVDGGPQLQSVLLPGQGQSAAVINGRLVRLGEKVGDGRLVRLSETEAVIAGPGGRQRLRLVPEVEKVAVQEKNDRKTSRRTKESP